MKYLLCQDGSPDANKALEYLCKIMRKDDSVVVFSCVISPIELVSDIFSVDTDAILVGERGTQNFQEELRRRTNESKSLVEKSSDRIKSSVEGIATANVKTVLVNGDVRDAIIDIAKKENVDTIVIGTWEAG
eukprot:TRINITY_DN4006_c0_g1_i2.p1 TRINITY_DN4006_c0_g1~~TRINITY_DN4006_c0_g1_i2.p1  ORF type:complete len:132 (+),score=13.55 TRINITY_DN4006_c0_g1_i2:175-570(+)